MTRDEAIKRITNHMEIHRFEEPRAIKITEALKMAIESLKQQEQRWIPISEKLPENAKHPGSFCPRYQVMTKWGVTEGWYNPDHKCWYFLIWFIDGNVIDFEGGTIPKLFNEVDGAKVVTHWREFPEPPKEDETH